MTTEKTNIIATPAFLLYITAWISGLVCLYLIWPILGLRADSFQAYYNSLGTVTRVWGYIVGTALLITLLFLFLKSLLVGTLRSLTIRLTRIERILWLIFLANIIWTVVGLLLGNPISYLMGDALKGMIFPTIYWIGNRSIRSPEEALKIIKVILWGETMLLCVLVPTGFIPFSQGGRTFLSTVFFTLLLEETSVRRRVLYACLLVFGVYAIFTTSAVRGIMIIFVIMIILNYFFRLRKIQFRTVFFAFMIPTILLLLANDILELKLEGYADWAEKRFSGSISRESKFFGLDESLAQRVGETIDVGRAFAQSSPFFLLTGFGNGALLHNELILPVELATYKTPHKHNIYITAVAVLFRNGLMGLILYGMIGGYVIRILFRMRSARRVLRVHRRFVYFKVLLLYHLSVLILSFIVYWYVGNLVVAFTIPLIEIMRRDMEITVQANTKTVAS